MGEISRRDTFETSSIMFRSKIVSPGQKVGNLTHFVAPQNAIPGSGSTMVKKNKSKFSGVGGKNGWNFQEGYFRDHWRHVPERSSLSRAKIWKFDPFCRISKCNLRFWSHDGQKDRIEIFGHGSAKMGEISRRDTFETTSIMFWSKVLSPLHKFRNLTHFVAPQNVIPGSGRTRVKKTELKFSGVGRQKWVIFPGGILSRPLASCSWAKFHPFWPPHGWKFWFGLFDRWAARTRDCILRCNETGQISKFLPWRENFAPEHDANGLESILPGNFPHFCHPMPENFDSVFLTVVLSEPEIAFWDATKWVKFPNLWPGERILLQNMTPVASKVSLLEISPIFATPRPKISIWSFWPLCYQNLGSHFEVRRNWSNFHMFALERECCSGTWRQWSRKYLFWKFHPFRQS